MLKRTDEPQRFYGNVIPSFTWDNTEERNYEFMAARSRVSTRRLGDIPGITAPVKVKSLMEDLGYNPDTTAKDVADEFCESIQQYIAGETGHHLVKKYGWR